ncbi:hypothetical protein JXB02_06235 [Candidatus Woesearchaeota archaeon]|nr:hypothetical protein [Candidatus Woesearchaeota archaeon]
MKGYMALLLCAVFVFSVVRVGSVASSHTEPGDELEMLVNVRNDGMSKEHDLRLRVYFPDFGEYLVTNSIDVGSGDTVSRMLFSDVPFAAEPGFYPVKVTLSNDEQRTTKWHWVEIV